MLKSVCILVVSLVILSLVKGQGIGPPRPAQNPAGAGGLPVPMDPQPQDPTQQQQQPMYEPGLFDWLFFDKPVNTNPAPGPAQVPATNQGGGMEPWGLAMLMGMDFGF